VRLESAARGQYYVCFVRWPDGPESNLSCLRTSYLGPLAGKIHELLQPSRRLTRLLQSYIEEFCRVYLWQTKLVKSPKRGMEELS